MSDPASSQPVIAIDPGREKCGVAVVSPEGVLLAKAVVPAPELTAHLRHLLASHPEARLVLGDSTGAREVQRRIDTDLAGRAYDVISEYRSTERALTRWRETVAPTGWQRLLPRALRFPREPIDDFAAWILAEDWLAR